MNLNDNYILISDIHFGMKKNSMQYFDEQMNFFNKQFFPYIKDKAIKQVIHLGDFFDNRKNIDVYILNRIIAEFISFFEENQIEFISLVGNHDSYFKSSINPNSLSVFKEFKFIKIIDTLTIIDNNLFVPYCNNYNENDLKEFCKKYDKIFGHFEINGFEFIKGIFCQNGIDKNIFNKQEKGNILYIGSPFYDNWNSLNEQRGFYHNKFNEFIFIENTTSRKYVEIKDYNSYKEFENIENNYIRIIINDNDIKDNNFIEFKQKIESLNAYSIDIVFDSNKKEEDIVLELKDYDLSNLYDYKKLFYDYTDSIELPKELNKNTMKNIIDNLLEGVNND